MARMVLGIFGDRVMAEKAITELESEGLNPKDISIIMKDRSEAKEMSGSTGNNIGGGAAAGATTGGVIGALAGLLTGIGAIAIPGIGALLIGGPIAVALGLTGAAATTVSGAVTGIVAGGVLGGLIGLGVPEEDARVYEEKIREGGILLAVPSPAGSEVDVQEIMDACGATQVRMINFSDHDEHLREHEAQGAYFHDVGRRKRF